MCTSKNIHSITNTHGHRVKGSNWLNIPKRAYDLFINNNIIRMIFYRGIICNSRMNICWWWKENASGVNAKWLVLLFTTSTIIFNFHNYDNTYGLYISWLYKRFLLHTKSRLFLYLNLCARAPLYTLFIAQSTLNRSARKSIQFFTHYWSSRGLSI